MNKILILQQLYNLADDALEYQLLDALSDEENFPPRISYDTANNIAWRGTGLKLTSLTACSGNSVAAARKTVFTYDTRHRLTNTEFGDASASIVRTYIPDGLPATIASHGTVWTYGYNKRRLLESESLSYAGVNYDIGYSYDANGALAQLRYPGNSLTIDYNPNALGEATHVGGYANNITYYPTAAVKSFLYGNGVFHTMQQNLRGLPESASDAGVLGDTYAYDENANVKSVTDVLQGTTTRNGMLYDGLDRLTSVASPLWGTATYGYDAVDNLTSTTITGGATARSTVHTINATTNRLDKISGNAGYAIAMAYDLQGNLTNRGSQVLQFDLANRMGGATNLATHVYDGLGRRVSTVGTDGVNRIQVYDQAGQLLYTTGGGTTIRYVYLNRHVIAEVRR